MQHLDSEETTKKQSYLRQQIIDEGYNAQDFFQYLVTLKNDGSNIDNWTLQQLHTIVRNYKSKQTESGLNSRLSQEKALANYQMITNKQIVNIFQEKEKRLEYEKYNLFDVAFKRKVEAVPFKGFLNEYSPPQIIVEKPQVKINPGLFFGIGRSAELWYLVRSNIINVSVKRSDGDMDWLRTTLLKLYPGSIIPPFIKCTTDLEKEQRRSLQRRSKMCHFYLNAIAQNRLIFNTKLFVAFVSWSDYNKFCEMKKQYDKMQPPKTLSQMPSETGSIEVQLSTRNRCIVKAVDVFANSLDGLHDKAHCELQNVGRDFDKAAETLLKAGNCFAEMQEHYSNMVNYAPDAKCDRFSETMIALNNAFFGWGKLLQQVRKQINEHVGLVFRFCREENRIVREYIAKRNDLQQHYLKLKGQLIQRKSKLYLDPTQWQIPPNVLNKAKNVSELTREEVIDLLLPKQTQQQSQMRDHLSFLNKSLEKEFLRVIEVLSNRLKDAFGRLAEPLANNIKQQVDVLHKLRGLSDQPQKKKT